MIAAEREKANMVKPPDFFFLLIIAQTMALSDTDLLHLHKLTDLYV